MKNYIDFNNISGTNLKFSFLGESQEMPLVVTPLKGEMDILDVKMHCDILNAYLEKTGALLFRGFKNHSKYTFNQFISGLSGKPLKYTERSSPRHSVYKNIFTSTDHPSDREILLHSEQSYNLSFPLKIFFYCEKPAAKGGNTPISDTRKILSYISKKTREEFQRRQYRYTRYFWPLMGTPWQTAFQTSNKTDVEKYCEQFDIHLNWQPDDALSTYQIRPMIATHPVSKEKCWFNHCAFFNIFSLDSKTREMLLASFSETELPNNTFYGDGENIDPETIAEIIDAYQAQKVEFEWQTGDILMLDNMLTSHGRTPFTGDRSILVGMSELCNWNDVL